MCAAGKRRASSSKSGNKKTSCEGSGKVQGRFREEMRELLEEWQQEDLLRRAGLAVYL
jgi:hypothetical protein